MDNTSYLNHQRRVSRRNDNPGNVISTAKENLVVILRVRNTDMFSFRAKTEYFGYFVRVLFAGYFAVATQLELNG